ncbi:autotransporter outer membrane beta-barrel domain-containing protein [Salmonella enterica subsp. enterica serovar Kentucky]|uniref:autotransporter-associated beta strand repeat-containing protein n=1 Tax=Salmonella enterica TaxID=28901 RepID=UPI0012BE2A7E|nr:autotransporter-associated beta strand repeat-containing protein [Salmonella enterica]EBK2117997.1 autotransporter outer membrane beta-barrel domain-containing protein [Salmonella enterica subsp. enterica serovar Kentucky]EBN0946143.1 autotransporter outer membrane beta-barrel domain-containing protein [Salmonella enterica]EDS9669904.1 autotransporter outer membrane beta-barrel domain-containing protein [Salmonella enterica]EDY4989740.1 autotransporter outer membrane beta-barrel domain-conta
MNKTYNIIWNAARGMYIVTSELARSGSRAIVSVSASCAVTLLAMDAAPAVAEETRVSIPSQTTPYTLSGATPFVVETGNTVATDIATSAAIVGDNSNDWDLLIESGAVVGSSLTDSQAMNLDSLTGATSVHNQGTITGSNEDGTILLQNGGSVINDGRIENSATYEHDPQDIPQEYAGVYMLNGGSYVSSESGVLEGVSGVIVQSGEAHITNGGMINSDGSWRSYGVEFRDGTYGTIVNTGTIITTASDGSSKIEDAAIYVHTLNDMAVSGSVSVDNSGLMQSDFITVALYHGSHFEVVNRVGGVITAGNSSLVGIKSTAMELKVGVDNLVTNDGTISAYGTANTYGIHYGESTSGGVITNTGSITTTGGGAGDASVYVHGNGDGTVVNNSGTMSSTVYGVYLDSARSKGHTLNNQAGSAISANTAVAINGNGNTITNQGKMTGVSDGLLISGNNNIVTTSGGEISGKNGIRVSKGSGNQITAKSGSKITATSTGISIASGNNQVTTESGSAIVAKDNGILINSGANNVTNGGSITATGSSNSYGIQYNSGASGTITNTGTITTTGKGVGDASVYAHGGAVTINNSGTMDSSVFGVYVTTGHTLNNLAGGSISANTAVQFHGNNNKLANAGAISGDTNGVTISGSGNTLTNQGKITGGTNAILINSGSKNNTLTLNTGTEISGSITDDNNSASANNNLILDGEGTLGSSISGLNSVTSSGDWTLSGATMNLSGTTNSALWVKSGTLILNGAMTAKGGTVDSGTTLQIGNGGTLGAFNGDIVDNGTLTFNRSDAAAYGSVISGSGNVVKQGGGELTLSNNNSYSGGTTIAEGTLTATAGGALGSGNIDNRAYLKLDAASASDPFIVADLTTHSGATVEIGAGSTLQANTLTQQDGSTLTADLTATSGPAIRAKNVNLDGTLNVASPASQEPIRSTDDLISLALIESDNAISGDFDDITINGNAMNPDAFITVVGQKNVNDTHYDLVETLTWYADRYNAAIDAHGTFNLADADDSFTVNTVLENVDANSGWNGQSLTKTGAGTLILNAENTYTGGTTISGGTLVASNVDALGSGDVTDNATLEMNTGGDFANNIGGTGRVVKSGDKTLTLSGANSYTGGTTISGGTLVANNVEALGTGSVTDNATLELNTGGDFDNAISGSGQVVKSGDKTLTLSGANSYSGATTISGGTLIATHVNALGTGAIDNRASLLLDASGQFTVTDLTTESGGNTEIGAGSTLQATTLTQKSDSTLTINLNSNTVDPVIHAASQVSLAGTLDITGVGDVLDSDPASTDDLDTFTLIASDKTIAGDFEKLTVAGMDADLADFITVDGRIDGTGKQYELTTALTWYADRDDAVTDAHGTFNLTNADGSFAVNTVLENVDATLDPASATGWDGTSLIKQGAGTLILNAENTYTGGTTISGGTLVATNVDALGSGAVTDDATLELNTGGTFDNAISGSGQVVKSGDDVLTLSGANSYSGGTLISDGTLVASNVEALGSGDVTDNATLELNTGGTFDNAISGSGKVEKSGDDALTLSGANTYTGGTLISDGTLVASNVEALGTGDVTDNAVLELNTGGDFDNAISGSGQVEKSGDGTLTLSGSNTYTGGTTINDGTLIATSVDALGSGDVTDNATLALNTGGTFDNAISGSGQVVKSGDDVLTLSGANSYSGGTLISDGTLVASNVEALGSGDVTNDAVLELNTGGTFDNTISGSGRVVKSGDGALTLSGANSYSGGTLISDGTLIAGRVDVLGSGDVTDNATLELNTGGTFDNAISGSGQVVKSGDDVLTLSGANSYSGGTLISDGTLVASNVEALGTGDVTDNATLEMNTGGTFDNVISGSGQVVKSGDDTLTLSGANSYTGGTLISGGTLVATSVEALGSGDVTDNAVLELNTGGTFDNAISGSGQVVKSGDKTLTLSGANSYTGGTTISGGTLVASNVEALGSGDIDNYASLQLNASGQFVTANLTTHDNAITAIGAGSALRANTLTQEANSTLAVHLTDSNSGAIVTADRANLGGTLDITGIGNVAKSWTRDAYAYTLIDSDSAIDSDFAQFTVAGMDAKQVDFLTVDGRVNADDDTRYDVTASLSWYADSDNAATDAHGTFTLSEQGHSFTLNTALTDVDATLNPDSATYWDGKSLIKRGAGTLILGAQNTYSGDTDVQEGALWLAETATIGSAGSAQAVNIAANAAFGGHNATVNGHVNNLGNLYFVDTFTVNGDVVNSSAMISGSDQPNNTLTIAGNYTGNDGHLYLNTQLGDDSSPTDKLIVTGDTAGSTTLHITNVNGLGAQTVNGIEVIEVGGQSDGDFRLYKGHVDINAWTYTLKQDGGDWYLRSESDDVPDDGGDVTPPDDGGDVTPPDDGGDVIPPDDGGDITPPDGGGDITPPDGGGDVTPPDDGGDITPPDDGGDITPPDGGDVTPVAPQYRADIGVYLGNQWMARNLQMQTLYDREGSQYRSADGSVWMRFKAGKAESQAVNGNVDIDSDYSQFQLGGDILTWSDGAQSVTVGLMGSYINASTDSTGNRGADGSQFSANGSVDGYNLGLYATWFADAQSHRGAYIDSWYQYGAYNNSVDNDGLSASRYDSAAHAVSLETGYRYDIALSNRNTVSLTPQAQVTWQRYSADTVIDDGGTRISGQNDDSWTTRLGVRVDGKLYKESGRIQPFMEVNWLHASDNASATFGDTKVSQDLPNDRMEVKVGIQANVSERLSVYAQAAGQKGKNDYGDASFSLNMRYNW